jgi:hypothetical protein
MESRTGTVCLLSVLTFFALTIFANAQISTGSLSGTVVDASGAVVPGAVVTLTNEGTSAAQHTNTSAAGAFRFALLAVGHYQLEVSETGFSKLRISNIQVDANIERALGSLRLQVGQTSESVEVSSAPPLIEAAQAQISSAISGEALQTFSGIGEFQGMDYIALTLPGVAAARDNQFSNTNGVGFVVNGLRGRNNDQQIDGQNNNDSLIAGPSLQLSDTDFVSEYQATTGNFGPEYGRNSGSVINLVTNPGSNRWHGTVSGVETNSVLTSLTNIEKDFDTPPVLKPPRFNQEFSGGTIGGPLKKDRVFVFGGFDNLIDSSTSVSPSGSVTPTPNGIAQLGTCFPGSTSLKALSSYGPFAIGAGSPTASNVHTVYVDNPPIGNTNTTDPNTKEPACGYEVGQVQRTVPTGFHFYDFIGRLDVHLTNSDSVFFRYLFEKSLFFNVFATQNDIPAGYPFNEPALSQAALVDWTHIFNSHVLNELRIGYTRDAVQFGGNTLGNTIPPMADLNNALTAVGFVDSSQLNFGPNILFPEGRVVNTYQLQDNFSYMRGQHQLKWGANITHQYSPNIFLPGYNGQFTFNNYFDFAANTPSAVLLVVGNPNYAFKEWDNFLYVGDDWKLKSNLTLNLGLTWSYLGQPGNILHQEGVQHQAANPPLWDPSLPLSVTTLPELTPLHALFGPSIGFAWSPNGRFMGNGKTVVRGGYRLDYDPSYDNIYSNEAGSAPAVLSQTFTPTTSMPTLPGLPAAPFGPAVRSEYASLLPLGKLDPRNSPEQVSPSSFRPDKVHGWSLGVQRELTKDAVVEVRYVGNHAVDLFQSVNANPYIAGLASAFPSMVPAGLTPCPGNPSIPSAQGRVNCNAGIQLAIGNGGFSNYNGLQTEFRATNIFHQLTLRTNYTFSKTLDNTSEIYNTFGGGNTETYAQNPLNISGGEYGISGIDFPNTWTLSFVEDIPFMRAQHGVLGHVIGGWAFSGTYILQSGQPYTPSQEVVNAFSSPIEDVAFNQALNNGVPDVVRPFVGNPSAPADQVGIYASDACASSPVFSSWAAACNTPPGALISVNSLNANGTVTTVNKNQVRLIANGAQADAVFGMPFGTAGRNILRDYHTNIGDFTLFKNIKFGERATLQWHMTMNNVFNHPNYGNTIPGINPFIENAGILAPFTTFGNPKWVSSATLACPAGTRCVFFGLKVIY